MIGCGASHYTQRVIAALIHGCVAETSDVFQELCNSLTISAAHFQSQKVASS